MEIDEEGRIWKLQVRRGSRWHKSYFAPIPRKRAESRSRAGYLQVRITPEPGAPQVGAMAHRLVWHYFFGPIPDGMCINHKNGIKDDNRPENLEVVTYSENMSHAHKNRLLDQRGERNPNAKLSDKQVQEIRELYATGEFFQADLASRYNVSFQTISKIVRGERRSNQAGPTDSSDHRLDYMERDPKSGRFIRVGKKSAGQTRME
ncbi:MAG: HNH endonuclease [Methanophagales archaeon]|nr:HNH endonuclease [Methanophagales archaeon]